MSSTTKSKFKHQIDEDGLLIKNLKITDTKAIEFLQELDKSECEFILTRAIEIGIRVIGEQKTYEKVDYVEKEFQKLTGSIEKQIESVEEQLEEFFGEEGIMAEYSDDEHGLPAKIKETVMDEKTGIRAFFNPSNENSPLYQLRRDLSDEITSLRDVIVGDIESSKVYGKTSLKGKDFEKELLTFLRDIAKYYGDVVEPIGDVTTSRKRKVGDIKIGVRDPLLGDEQLVIVVEAKDRAYTSVEGKGGLLSELGQAIINRNADFGIAITKNRSGLPDYVGHFRFYEPNTIITCCEDLLAVELAYRFGRSIALARYLSQDVKKIDWENVQKFAIFLGNSLKKIDTTRKDIGTIEKGLKGIKGTLKSYRDEVDEALTKLLKSIEISGEEK